ncbi:hypothetical protein [Bacillus cereus]|nr:hypothetical protein [Bacillus cereus]
MMQNRLSTNLIGIIEGLVKDNKTLAKYLENNVSNPLTCKSFVDSEKYDCTKLIMTKVFPFPFDVDSTLQEGSQVRVFYYSGEMNTDTVVRDSLVVFDIILAKSLWLINDGKPSLRPYDIADEIMKHFRDKSITGVGRLHFIEFSHLMVNEKFSGIRLFAEVTDFVANDI